VGFLQVSGVSFAGIDKIKNQKQIKARSTLERVNH